MDILTDLLIGAVALLVAAVAWLVRSWISTGFNRNDREHGELREEIKFTRDTVHETREHLAGVKGRLDHVIHHHENMPPYEEVER